MLLTRPEPYPDPVPGRPSKKAAQVVLKAHLAVTKGDPIRLALSNALEKEKSLGGQERRFAAFATRELSRHQRWLDLAARLAGHPPGRWALAEDRVLVRYTLWRRHFTRAPWKTFAQEVALPGPLRPRSVHDRVLESASEAPLPPQDDITEATEQAAIVHSFPTWLSEALAALCGDAQLPELLAALNTDPDLFVRVRPPGTREARQRELADAGVQTEPVPWAADALRVTSEGMKIFDSPPMKSGALQVQEPGSQLIAAMCRIGGEASRPLVVDACAGAGGKTLAVADAVALSGGTVAAGDLSRKRLDEARRRTKALGVRNVSFPSPLPVDRADVVLIDAPCSGVGSLAREPEQKWKLTREKVAAFAKTQRTLLDDTAAALKPGAAIVYATCSLLREENEDVVQAFLAAHPSFSIEPALSVLGPSSASVCDGPFVRVWPHRAGGVGGFFTARLKKGSVG